MDMYKMTCVAILSAFAFLALPQHVLASSKPENTRMEKKSMQLDAQTTVDGKTLMPGEYKVLINGDKVTFEKDGQGVVTAPCQWKTLKFKAEYNAKLFSANHVLQELQFEGSNQALDVK